MIEFKSLLTDRYMIQQSMIRAAVTASTPPFSSYSSSASSTSSSSSSSRSSTSPKTSAAVKRKLSDDSEYSTFSSSSSMTNLDNKSIENDSNNRRRHPKKFILDSTIKNIYDFKKKEKQIEVDIEETEEIEEDEDIIDSISPSSSITTTKSSFSSSKMNTCDKKLTTPPSFLINDILGLSKSNNQASTQPKLQNIKQSEQINYDHQHQHHHHLQQQQQQDHFRLLNNLLLQQQQSYSTPCSKNLIDFFKLLVNANQINSTFNHQQPQYPINSPLNIINKERFDHNLPKTSTTIHHHHQQQHQQQQQRINIQIPNNDLNKKPKDYHRFNSVQYSNPILSSLEKLTRQQFEEEDGERDDKTLNLKRQNDNSIDKKSKLFKKNSDESSNINKNEKEISTATNVDNKIKSNNNEIPLSNGLPAWVFCTRYSDRPSAGKLVFYCYYY
jgi:hypothetical protein